MARAIHVQELNDPDFQWLLSSFKATHPEYIAVESGNLPVVLIECGDLTPPASPLMLGHEEHPKSQK